MRTTLAFLVGLMLMAVACWADDFYSSPAPPVVLPGAYTIAMLPDPTKVQAKYAFVSDLGGGADMVISDGTNWKHIRQGVVTNAAATATVTVTPLATPPLLQFTGSGLNLNMTVNVVTTNLYPGYTFRMIFPSGVLAATSLVGVSLNGGTAMSLGNPGGNWVDFQYANGTLVEIGKGPL